MRSTVKPDYQDSTELFYHHCAEVKTVTSLSNDVVLRYEADVTKVLNMDKKAIQLTDAAIQESGVAQNTLKQLSDLEKTLPKPLTVVNMD